ncbi:BMP family ABC transporter substrate-binding protein [Spiroplasma taiwanense]|uniref:Ribose/galactose ABC transporter substrate-binding protein n=1 Tax=Spiroplasma taiwanense CT-1 TaxID=1276220 RepID=S5MFY9_9MOLU|nr:BMP family ABC transporter substrate-binding protein [Spiroplasma taiwanense]AGR40780.1 ribose/galactose ABC transporter substrate-binding protein [Spiroplasma taiwanense CT-1]
MKKLLSSLMAAAIVTSSAATVVACGGGSGEKIWLITDTGKVADKSFNQSGFEGGNYFNENMLGIKREINKTEPQELTELEAAYENAKADGAQVLILPGFHHALEGQNKAADIMGESGSTIILDSTHAGKTNQIGVMFRGDVSGFYAAFSSLVQLAENKANVIKMATYGGTHNAGAVDNFMVGYLAAIEVFNKINSEDAYSEIKTSLGLDENLVTAERIQKEAPTADDDSKWFTNSFDPGKGKTISENLVTSGADIIMPVAGPQTKDTLDVISQKNASTMVIGVDTNQAQQYSDATYAGKFLTSAEKSLKDATIISLGHTKSFISEEGVQDKTLEYATNNNATFTIENSEGNFESYDLTKNKAETWEGKTLWMGGKASTGEGNLVTSENYSKVTSQISSEVLEKVSIELFKEIAKDSSAKNILSDETIINYANTILKAIENK